MLSVTSAQLDTWLAAFFFPLARVLALMAVAPPFSNAAMPNTIRLVLGLAITFGLTAALPPGVAPPAGSWLGLSILAKEMMIGIALGFGMQLTFAVLDMTGNLVGLQMGLGFATLYDPQSHGQTAVISQLFSMVAVLMFLSLNGHLVMLNLLGQSFTLLPVGQMPPMGNLKDLVMTGAMLFGTGLLMALPMLAALLITTIAMGILTRAAPQLNLFAVGFPVSMLVGFSMLALAMPHLGPAFEHLFEDGFRVMRAVIGAR